MVTIIVGREFAVTGLRFIALERNVPISANAWGKAKTTTQIIAVSLLIFGSHLGPLQILVHHRALGCAGTDHHLHGGLLSAELANHP